MKNGERMERTEWHRITIFGGVVGVIEKYTKKGSRIAITGKLRTRPWEDTNGLKHHTTEIIVDFDGRIELLDRPPNLDSAPAGEPVSDETINQLADGANQGATA
jgi:single-strand DNA-binding protein